MRNVLLPMTSLAPMDLTRCTEAARRLLEELGLAAYRFAIEPGETSWELRLECSAPEGWSSLVVPFDHEALAATLVDPVAHERMLDSWRDELRGCRLLPRS